MASRSALTWLVCGTLLELGTLSSCTIVVDHELASKSNGVDVPARDASADPDPDAAARSSADAARELARDAAERLPATDTDASMLPAQSDASLPGTDLGDAGGAPGRTASKLCVGENHGCALSSSGKVTCWGSDAWAQLSLGQRAEQFTDLSCGRYHSCGITSEGKVVCVGSNTDNQTLGAPSDADYVEVAAGVAHTCARKRDGSVTCWGAASSTFGEAKAPSEKLVAVALGDQVSCGIRALDGSLLCWGNPENARTRPPAGSGFTALALGGAAGCAITRTRELSCWGESSAVAPTLLGVRSVSVGASGRGCAQTDVDLVSWIGTNRELLSGLHDASAAGAFGICFLPLEGGQLVCETDLDNAALKTKVPMPYPLPRL